MKNVREKLISLLGMCSDDESTATKLQLLTNITQSSDYTTLSKSIALKKPYEELYEHSKLKELSNSELKQRSSLLQKIVSFNGKLVQSIRFGNGPELSSEDTPDFTSIKNLTKLCNKIQLSHDAVNYTNITEKNALLIFSDQTVKSAQRCLDMLPVEITKAKEIDEDTICKYMNGKSFCVNIEEFKSCHNNFLGFAEKNEGIIAKEKFRKKKHRLLKVSVVMLCFGTLFACSQFGLFSDTFTPIMTLVMFVVSILFLIWG